MTHSGTKTVAHEIAVAAPADVVYSLVVDVANWPQLFPPTVHVEHLERGEEHERIQIWATANGEAKTWTSRRDLDAERRRVDFRQERSQSPVASMGGAWIVEPLSDDRSLVRLLHDYRSANDDPDELAWIAQAVDRNSQSELAAMKLNAELAAKATPLSTTFEDTVYIHGAAQDVYDFINEAGLWPSRLPHVDTVSLQENSPGLQLLEMDTRAEGGASHTTKSVRVCFPHHKIVYKQTQLPPLMTLHTGAWRISGAGSGVEVTSRHTVVINEQNVPKVLGQEASVEQAGEYLRRALGTNSLTTMEHAKIFAEGGPRQLAAR